MTKDEELAMDLALEALELTWDSGMPHPNIMQVGKAITAIKQARSATVQDSTCNNALREQGKAYPRTCRKCGLGPCIALANIALDKKAENARELGLDYEPVPENFIDALKFDVAMREWVGLTPHERMMCRSYDIDTAIDKTEAKLKEKNP